MTIWSEGSVVRGNPPGVVVGDVALDMARCSTRYGSPRRHVVGHSTVVACTASATERLWED